MVCDNYHDSQKEMLEQPPVKHFSNQQPISFFTHALPYAQKSKLSINEHNFHFVLKHYPVLVCHN